MENMLRPINDVLIFMSILLLLLSAWQLNTYRTMETQIMDNYLRCQAPGYYNIQHNASAVEEYAEFQSGRRWKSSPES